MPLRGDVVVLEDARGVEVVHKGLVTALEPCRLLGNAIVHDRIVQVVVRVEPLNHVVDLFDPAAWSVGEVCVAGLVETQPE